MRTLRADWAVNPEGLTRVVLAVFRFGQWADQRGPLALLPYKIANLVLLKLLLGTDLPRQARIGPGLRLQHYGRGVAVHRTAVIGKRAELYQRVTVGQAGRPGAPVVGDRVTIGCGACVLGRIRVGDDVKIGAGAVVVKDVPDRSVVVAPPPITLQTDRAPTTIDAAT